MHQQPDIAAFIERITEAFVALDKNWNYTYLNKKAGEILNRNSGELIGKHIWTEFPGSIDQPVYNAYNQAIKNQEYVQVEEHYLPLDRWFENHIYPSADGLSIFFRDITERKKAEEEINRSKELLEMAESQAGLGSWDFEVATQKRKWSNHLFRLFGFEISEQPPPSEDLLERIHPDDREYFQTRIKDMLEGKDPIEYEFRTNPELVPLLYLCASWSLERDSDGKPIKFSGTILDITERKKAEAEIKIANEQLRQLTVHLQNIREEERKRIGREIHDELGQQLTAIKMDIAWIDKKIPEESSIIKTKLKNVVTLLDGSNLSIRKILNELRSDILENHGIIDALKWQGRQFTANTGIPLVFSSSETVLNVEASVGTCLFRVFQESLTNITRHANAKKVISSLHYSDDVIKLEIEDDGKGFDTVLSNEKLTYGNLGMRERVASLNGKFELLSSPGHGTKIIITIPFKS